MPTPIPAVYAEMIFLLAYATFIIGILLISIPAPVSWLRGAGFDLVADSYAALFLFTILLAFYNGADMLLDRLYPPLCFTIRDFGDRGVLVCRSGWDAAAVWLGREKSDVIAVLTELTVPNAILDALGGLSPLNIEPIITATQTVYGLAISPIQSAVNAYALLLIGLEYWTGFVRAYWWQLIFLGAVLWAVPARIGRIAGSWMIATPTVFYVGYPGLRLFLGWLTGYDHLLDAFHASLIAPLLTSAAATLGNPLAVATVMDSWLEAGSIFAGQVVFRLIALSLYIFILFLAVAGVASALSGASAPSVGVEPG